MVNLFQDKTMTMQETDVIINCRDGFKLRGTLFMPAEIKSVVMIAPATGIKRQFYAAFARYLAETTSE